MLSYSKYQIIIDIEQITDEQEAFKNIIHFRLFIKAVELASMFLLQSPHAWKIAKWLHKKQHRRRLVTKDTPANY